MGDTAPSTVDVPRGWSTSEVRCRTLIDALWSHNFIASGVLPDGRICIEVHATIPPLRGTTVAASAARASMGRTWAALLGVLRKIARRDVAQMAIRATSYEDKARALREKRQAIRNLLGDDEASRG